LDNQVDDVLGAHIHILGPSLAYVDLMAFKPLPEVVLPVRSYTDSSVKATVEGKVVAFWAVFQKYSDKLKDVSWAHTDVPWACRLNGELMRAVRGLKNSPNAVFMFRGSQLKGDG
jgi:hypothetical protein